MNSVKQVLSNECKFITITWSWISSFLIGQKFLNFFLPKIFLRSSSNFCTWILLEKNLNFDKKKFCLNQPLNFLPLRFSAVGLNHAVKKMVRKKCANFIRQPQSKEALVLESRILTFSQPQNLHFLDFYLLWCHNLVLENKFRSCGVKCEFWI